MIEEISVQSDLAQDSDPQGQQRLEIQNCNSRELDMREIVDRLRMRRVETNLGVPAARTRAYVSGLTAAELTVQLAESRHCPVAEDAEILHCADNCSFCSGGERMEQRRERWPGGSGDGPGLLLAAKRAMDTAVARCGRSLRGFDIQSASESARPTRWRRRAAGLKRPSASRFLNFRVNVPCRNVRPLWQACGGYHSGLCSI